MKKYINKEDAINILIEYFYEKGDYKKHLNKSEIDPKYIAFLVEDIRTFERLKLDLPKMYENSTNSCIISNSSYEFEQTLKELN